MFNPPTLSEAMRVADNKHKYLQMTGTPMDRVNWLDAEQQAQQMQPAPPPTMPMPSGGPPSTGSRFGAMPMPMQSFPTPGKLIQPTGYANGGPVNRSVAPIGSSAVGTGPPGSFWDEKTKSWVVGINTAQGRGNYLRAVGGNTASGGQVRDGVNFGYNGAGARFGMGGGMQPGMTIGGSGIGSMGTQAQPVSDPFASQPDIDPGSPYYDAEAARKQRTMAFGQGYAEGGEVDGPGGPKDDLIPAMLSDGEYIMPAEAVKFFGIDRLNKMKQKAMEGMEHMGKESEKEPSDMMRGYANGGMVVPLSLERAMADQDVAAAANYISPNAVIPTKGSGFFNREGGANTGWEAEGMGHYLFPQPGIDASTRAQASTQKAISDVGQFMAAQPGIDAAFDARTAKRQAMLSSLNDPQAVARMVASAPNPFLPSAEDLAGASRAVNGAVVGPETYGPTMNDHPAFNAPDPQTLADMRARRSAIRAAETIPGMIAPTFEPQPRTATFAPQMVGATVPASSSIPISPSSFMAPWERDAQAAAARDAASGRPEGMRKTDWRRMQASPSFILAQQGRQDRAAEMGMAARTRADERMVDWQRQQAMSNQAIGLDAARQAAQQQQRTDERTVDWQRNEAARNQAIGMDAQQREAARVAEQAQWEKRNKITSRQAMEAGAASAKAREETWQQHFERTQAAKALKTPVVGENEASGPDGKLGIKFRTHSDGSKSVEGVATEPTEDQKRAAFKFMTGKELANDERDWSDAWYYATGQRPQPRAAPKSKPAGKIKSVTEVK